MGIGRNMNGEIRRHQTPKRTFKKNWLNEYGEIKWEKGIKCAYDNRIWWTNWQYENMTAVWLCVREMNLCWHFYGLKLVDFAYFVQRISFSRARQAFVNAAIEYNLCHCSLLNSSLNRNGTLACATKFQVFRQFGSDLWSATNKYQIQRPKKTNHIQIGMFSYAAPT